MMALTKEQVKALVMGWAEACIGEFCVGDEERADEREELRMVLDWIEANPAV
jgi:hypothetical protein